MCGTVLGGFEGERMCSVWDSLGRFWGIETVLRVGELFVGLVECVCAVCGKVWCGIG